MTGSTLQSAGRANDELSVGAKVSSQSLSYLLYTAGTLSSNLTLAF
jgi:hypothetical protein